MKPLFLLSFIAMIARPIHARDVWMLGGFAESQAGACARIRWVADPIVYNLTPDSISVKVVHVSNGGAEGVESTVPAFSLARVTSLGAGSNDSMWISHLEIPASAYVEGRMEYFNVNQCSLFPPDPVPEGKVATPVFTKLVSPATPQVHVGTDLGRQAVRMNVTIYNAANVTAFATISVRLPSCADTPSAEREIRIAADTVIQVPMGTVKCTQGAVWPSYVTVTVDQPSLSFVSTLSNDVAPGATVQLSTAPD